MDVRSLVVEIAQKKSARPVKVFEAQQVHDWLRDKKLPVGVSEWYRFAHWLWNTGTQDMAVILKLMDECHRLKPKNPYAYFARDHHTREVMTEGHHAEQAIAEHERIKQEEREFFS